MPPPNLNQSVLSISLDDCLHELINKVIICRTSDSLVPQANIQGVVQQLLKYKHDKLNITQLYKQEAVHSHEGEYDFVGRRVQLCLGSLVTNHSIQQEIKCRQCSLKAGNSCN